jgi:hypothetical protein
MHVTGLARAVLALLAVLAAGCSGSDDIQWMKVNEKYTTEEFRRDWTACAKGSKVDETCMRDRGWVSVNTPKVKTENPDVQSRRKSY